MHDVANEAAIWERKPGTLKQKYNRAKKNEQGATGVNGT